MTPAQVAHIMPPLPKPLTLSRGDEDGAIQLGYTAEQMQAYARAAVEAALRDAPQQAEGWVMVPADVVKFLTGEGPLDGLWFGEHPFGLGGGKYWWRKHLHAARPSAPTAVEPDERHNFEAAYRARYPVSCDLDPAKFNRSDEGDYEDIRVSIAWAMWQARALKGTPL